VKLIMVLLLLFASKQVSSAQTLRIEVIRGEGAIHNVRDKEPLRPAVRVVRGDAGDPVPGASVTMRLPDSGPSGLFTSGRILTLITNSGGEAAPPGSFRTNMQLGSWEIRVSASHQGETARAVIPQTNAAPVEAFVSPGGGSRRTRLLLAALAAGAAGAALGVTGYGSRGRSTAAVGAPPSVAAAPIGLTVTPGAGSVGAP
jgi:hypothetical protein